MGDPVSVPAGRYTKEALEKAGWWDKLSPKLILAESVRQVLDYVSRGEVDAGPGLLPPTRPLPRGR